MKISDLREPITGAKSDYGLASNYIGFTPTGGGPDAYAKCQSTVQRQMGRGLVLEYITETLPEPNAGFEDHPAYVRNKRDHERFHGCLIGVHRLRASSHPLRVIVGDDEFNLLQDMWAQEGKRHRWSVAFPIDESYEFVAHPRAIEAFGGEGYRRLFGHPSALLRPLTPDDQTSLAGLEITLRSSTNRWIGVDQEIQKAELSDVNPRTLSLIEADLSDRALEGVDLERRGKLRRRAAWLADRLIRRRHSEGTLRCDVCPFDPAEAIAGRNVRPRSLLDVHHINPLGLGERYTEERDLALLCPNCHRLEHRLMETGETLFGPRT